MNVPGNRILGNSPGKRAKKGDGVLWAPYPQRKELILLLALKAPETLRQGRMWRSPDGTLECVHAPDLALAVELGT
jgi:hypothetical protein